MQWSMMDGSYYLSYLLPLNYSYHYYSTITHIKAHKYKYINIRTLLQTPQFFKQMMQQAMSMMGGAGGGGGGMPDMSALAAMMREGGICGLFMFVFLVFVYVREKKSESA